jgi:integrase
MALGFLKLCGAVSSFDGRSRSTTLVEAEPLAAKYSGLYALRHLFASWCAARKEDMAGWACPLKTVQVCMGHSTPAMTADRYGHLFPSQDDAEVLAAGERALMGA